MSRSGVDNSIIEIVIWIVSRMAMNTHRERCLRMTIEEDFQDGTINGWERECNALEAEK
jgi:hypothetical protein